MAWTQPVDIEAKLRRYWDKGRILKACLADESLFPLILPLSGPTSQELSDRFDEVRAWIRALEAGAKSSRGFGYDIQCTEVNHRRLGRNPIPASIIVATENDALALLGKATAASRFRSLSSRTLVSFPGLKEWLLSNPLKLLDHAERWERLLAVLAWMKENPRPGLYLRQVDIAGVDTKFIGSNEGILKELLKAIAVGMDDELNESGPMGRSFELRHGFLSKPLLIRFRILDPSLYIHGLSDLTGRVEEIARLELPVRKVIVTENEINGLTFPALEGGVVLFGLGYGVDTLGAIPWLKQADVFYWGDIDSHGFAILDRFRAFFPASRSLLMDREIFMAHREYWVEETRPANATLTRLTSEEGLLYEELKRNSYGRNVRLEQERIGFSWLKNVLSDPGQGLKSGF